MILIIRSPWRNLIPAAGFLSLAVLLGSLVFQQRFQEDLRVVLKEENLRVARLAVELLKSGDDPQAIVDRTSVLTDARITLIQPDGTVTAESSTDPTSMDDHSGRPEILTARESEWGHSIRESSTLDQMMLYTAVRIDDPEGNIEAFVRVSRSLDQIDELTRSVTQTIWIAAFVVILMGTLTCYLFLEQRLARTERIHKQAGENQDAPG